MTHVICRAMTCLFWEGGVCTAEEIEYEPDVGCLTFQDLGDLDLEAGEEEESDWEEGAEEELFEEEEEDWKDEDEWEDEDDLGA